MALMSSSPPSPPPPPPPPHTPAPPPHTHSTPALHPPCPAPFPLFPCRSATSVQVIVLDDESNGHNFMPHTFNVLGDISVVNDLERVRVCATPFCGPLLHVA